MTLYIVIWVCFILLMIYLGRIDEDKLLTKKESFLIESDLIPSIDKTKLDKWYKNAVSKKSKKNNRLIRRINLITIFLQIVFFLSILSVFIILEKFTDNKQLGGELLLVLLINSVYLISLISAKYSSSKQVDNYYAQFSKLIPIDKKTHKNIWEKVVAVQKRIGLSDYKIDLFFFPSNSNSPSIIENQNSIQVIFPRNFLITSLENPELLDPILTHELAHIIHKDQKESLFSQIYVDKIRGPVELMFMLSIIMAFVSFMEGEIPYMAPGTIISGTILLFTKNARFAEHLADIVVLRISNISNFGKYIMQYSNNESLNGKHPASIMRIEFLNRIIRTHQKS